MCQLYKGFAILRIVIISFSLHTTPPIVCFLSGDLGTSMTVTWLPASPHCALHMGPSLSFNQDLHPSPSSLTEGLPWCLQLMQQGYWNGSCDWGNGCPPGNTPNGITSFRLPSTSLVTRHRCFLPSVVICWMLFIPLSSKILLLELHTAIK
jgi:hypothetical protein